MTRFDVTRDECERLVAEGLTVCQAAERLGCSRDTVAARLGMKPSLLRGPEARQADERYRREALAARIAAAAPRAIHDEPRRGIRHLSGSERLRYATLGAGGAREETAGTTWGPLAESEIAALLARGVQ